MKKLLILLVIGFSQISFASDYCEVSYVVDDQTVTVGVSEFHGDKISKVASVKIYEGAFEIWILIKEDKAGITLGLIDKNYEIISWFDADYKNRANWTNSRPVNYKVLCKKN